ncbi:condensation domain-containing protein [Streptacidiphilus cavernicola]|uniref:Condensation domain-containing protein n=1 Tax=Streptacidiphilus cavernicola TaxID=3342716 RepID=A0ABV6VPJ8_9ACTN
MTGSVERITVAFEGDGAGEGELSWGQSENWSTITAIGNWFPLGGVKPLPPETTVEDITAELAYLMGRYPPLRTRLRFAEDGRPLQVVSGSGEIALELLDAEDDDDPDKAADALSERYRGADLDFSTDWPVRMGLVRHRGRLTHLVVLMSHLAVDGAGALIMMGEVAARTAAPAPELQPLAQARWQQSPAGQRQNAAALRHHESILRGVDPRRYRPQPTPDQPRYWQGEFDSPAMLPAVLAIAERTGLGSSTVLLALFARSLSAVTGIQPVVLRPIVGNRFRPGLAEVVCTLAQAGLCVLDVAGEDFDAVVGKAQKSLVSAYKHGYFDPAAMERLRLRVAADRGAAVDTACFFNDRRGAAQQLAVRPEPTAGAADGTPRPGSFRWVLGQDSPSLESLFLQVDDAPGTVHLTFVMDTHCLSLADGEALVRGMETAALAEAADPVVAGAVSDR